MRRLYIFFPILLIISLGVFIFFEGSFNKHQAKTSSSQLLADGIFAYALGTGIPLYFIAKGGRAASQKLTFFKAENQTIRRVFGVIVLATSLFIWTGADRALQAWVLAYFSTSWIQPSIVFEEKINVNRLLQELKNR